jgi:SAM-dependent methyltransferase
MTPGLVNAVALLVHVGKKCGPTPAMYANVHQAFKVLQKSEITSEQIYDLVVKFAAVGGCYNILPRIFDQRFGYPGDFELLGTYYEAFDSDYAGYLFGDVYPDFDTPMMSPWDHYLLSTPVAQSVYNREQYLLRRVDELVSEGKVNSILDIACGDGRLLRKIQDKHPQLYTHGIDNEPKAILKAKTLAESGTEFTRMNVLTELPDRPYDLVISAGLCDYLHDGHFTRLVRRLEYSIQPKYVILGNLTHHDHEAEMSLLRWRLIYRMEIELIALAANYFQDKTFFVDAEEQGVNLFLNIVPKE